MNPRAAVLLGLTVSGAAIVVGGAARGQLPRPRRLLGAGAAFVAIAAVADAQPRLAAPLAGLVTAGVVLAQGEDAARGVLRGITSRAPLGSKPVPDTAASTAPGATPTAGAGTPSAPAAGGPLAGMVRGPGGSSSPPLAGSFPIIGTPGAGTHSRSAPPANWQSDEAVDIAAPVGTPVLAVRAGVIGDRIGPLSSSDPRMAGLRVSLRAPDGTEWYYAHLSRLTVRAGQSVPAGALLGYSGSANGTAHLHFAVNRGDPRSYL